MKSAILVSYKDAAYLEENIKLLLKEGYEIILAVDKPSKEVIKLSKKYPVKTCFSDKRRGKWKALNDAIKLAEGDELLFVDSDTIIRKTPNLNSCEVAEAVKKIRSFTVLQHLINIEYIIYAIIGKLAERLNTCFFFNGSCFVIKKKVLKDLGGFRRKITEDFDLGVRVGKKGYKYKVNGFAETSAPDSLTSFINQRLRWGMGGAEVFFDNFSYIIKNWKYWILILFFYYPLISVILLSMLLSKDFLLNLLLLIFSVVSIFSIKLGLMLLLLMYEIYLFKILFLSFLSFLFWVVPILIASKKLKYEIKKRYLLLYYFVYSPFLSLIYIVSLLHYVYYKVTKKPVKVPKWKL